MNTQKKVTELLYAQFNRVGYIVALVGCLYSTISEAGMFYDNRFFPFWQQIFITSAGRPSHASFSVFFTAAGSALRREETEMGLYEMYGSYDEHQLAESMTKAGYQNPFKKAHRDDLINADPLHWDVGGKIQGQGLTFSFRYALTDNIAGGLFWYIMRANARQEFFLDDQRDQRDALDQIRRQMHQDIGLYGPQSDESGFGDLDLYLRLGDAWDYTMKFRRIDLGVRLGLLIPAGRRADILKPASVPFGGDGFWGFYVMSENELELKEDWKAGLFLGVSKRLPKVVVRRLPLAKEPYIFAPLTGDVKVSPGATFMFSPYFAVENLREGLGARIQYTLAVHAEDEWCDRRCDQSKIINLNPVVAQSSWTQGHVTLCGFYDFGKLKVKRRLEPIISLSWVVPASVFSTKRVAKSSLIDIGLECNF